MEGGRRKRKPLADCTTTAAAAAANKRKVLTDCTNTTTTTSPANKKPSLASAFKKIVANDAGINSNSKPGLNVVESATLVSPSSSVAVASTPTKTGMVSGTGDCEVVEPCSVYSRRTADRRMSKGKEVVRSLPISIDAIGDGNKEDKVTGPPKSRKVHHKRKKKDEPVHAMPQDFIEKQRAYFAEVDAFELPEEEVDAFELPGEEEDQLE